VNRSPFFTQSVAVIARRRSLRRVMISSPALAAVPSASGVSRPPRFALAVPVVLLVVLPVGRGGRRAGQRGRVR
jgi:hypothetical protein